MARYDNFYMNEYEDFIGVLEKAYDKGYNQGYDQGLKDGEDNSNDRYDDGYNEGLDKDRDEERDRSILEKLQDITKQQSDGYIAIVFPEFVQRLVDNRHLLTPAIIEKLEALLVEERVF